MTPRRHYVFDLRAGRLIVVDGTGEAALGADRLAALLDHLRREGRDDVLRAFAADAARGLLGAHASAEARALVEAADTEGPEGLARVQNAYGSVAMAAGCVGLKNGLASAAAFMAAFCACAPVAHAAATETARMVQLHAELSDSGAHPDAITARHRDALLDRLAPGV